MARSSHYPGKINYQSITIPNDAPEKMRDQLNALPFIAYHVETLVDGRKVCITKPGGKQFWGNLQPNDFMVWVYDEEGEDRWRIKHKDIYLDIKAKLESNAKLAADFVAVLHEVCRGTEPRATQLLAHFSALPGLPAELVLKVYKWIWIQEDCNYPTGDGRWRSMNPILEMTSKYDLNR